MFGFLKWRVKRSKPAVDDSAKVTKVAVKAKQWQPVPHYLPVDPRQHLPVVLAASAIAASQATTSKLQFKRLYQQNPEAKRVSLIATALAAATSGQQFVVKSIKKKVSDSDHAEKV